MKYTRRLFIPTSIATLFGSVSLLRAEEPAKGEGGNRLAHLAGSWTITYHPSKAVRTYTITEHGEVAFAESTIDGQITREGASLLLMFPAEPEKLERLTAGSDGRIFVEHFNPKSDFPDTPNQIGIGVPRQ